MKTMPYNLQNLSQDELIRLLQQQGEAIAQKDKAIVQKDKAIVQKDKAIVQKDKAIHSKEKRIAQLEEDLRLATAQRYGKRSEKRDPNAPYQSELFNEADELDAEPPEPNGDTDSSETITYTRKKRGGRAKLSDKLERRRVVRDLDEAEKVCSCGCSLTQIGEETSERLQIIPEQVYVEQEVRLKYACKACEESVHTAEKSAQLLPKTNAGSGLLAYAITAKYQDSLPLVRQSKIFARHGIQLPSNTLARWVIKTSEAVQPLIERLAYYSQQAPVILMDETPLQVNKEPGREANTKSYMWVRRALAPPNEGQPQQDITLYHYSPSRSGDIPRQLLYGYRGALVTDDYAGYNAVVAENRLQHGLCWAHARRKYDEAEKSLPKGKKSPAITSIKNEIGKLYGIEKQVKGLNAAERQQQRQEKAKPILEKLKKSLDEKLLKVTPKSRLGKAIAYTLKNWRELTTYLDNGLMPIDNNGAERAIRPFVIGRKNWVFSDTPAGAKASATLYSLIETAKANGQEPYYYLRHLFEELPNARDKEAVDALLP